MFVAGNILHIKDFEFSNIAKSKYLIVLCNDGENAIVASFTTSKTYVNDEDIKPGIIKTDKKLCFHFPAGEVVGVDNDFAFPKNTFVFPFQNIRNFRIEQLTHKYGDRISRVGKLKVRWFYDLLYCIYCSEYIKKKQKVLLEALLNKIAAELESKREG